MSFDKYHNMRVAMLTSATKMSETGTIKMLSKKNMANINSKLCNLAILTLWSCMHGIV